MKKMDKYLCIYDGKKIEVEALSIVGARIKAMHIFNAESIRKIKTFLVVSKYGRNYMDEWLAD